MKRILMIAMCLCLLHSVPVRAAAEETGIYENAGALYEAWVTADCVPDYITAVISTDGGSDNLTFGLVEGEAGEQGRQEILELVKDDSTVTVLYQTYSRNALYRIQDAIVNEYFGRDLGLVTAGVSEWANQLIVEIKTDYAENADTLQMIREVTEQYGDRVSFRFTDSEIQAVVSIQTAPKNPIRVMAGPGGSFDLPAFSLILCAMMLAVPGCLAIRRGRCIAAGNVAAVTSDARPVRRKQIENTIRDTGIQPSAHLQARVMRTIGTSAEDDSGY